MKYLLKMLIWLGRLFYTLYYRLKPEAAQLIPGIPYNRDPNAPCEAYEPFLQPRKEYFTDCETDGHYLCKKCCHRKVENQPE